MKQLVYGVASVNACTYYLLNLDVLVGCFFDHLGVGMLFFQLTLYTWIERILGPITVSRIGAVRLCKTRISCICNPSLGFLLTFRLLQVISIPLLSSYPFLAELSGLILLLLLNFASMLKNILSVSSHFYSSRHCSSILSILRLFH